MKKTGKDASTAGIKSPYIKDLMPDFAITRAGQHTGNEEENGRT